MGDPFATRLSDSARATEAALDRFLSPSASPGETVRPLRLITAMRYAVLGRGRRLCPFILIEAAQLFGSNGETVIAAAAALECVHAYRFIHDDLPALSDENLRRGQPTLHLAFDEATAILAGDALLILAFDIIADRDDLIRPLARAAGLGGMVGGQILDLGAEAGAFDVDDIVRLQTMKTGSLFRFAAEAGAILGGASLEDRARLAAYGTRLGLALRLADDLIAATASAKPAGKPTRKDGRRKPSIVAIRGIAGARALLDETVEEAIGSLAPFGAAAASLAEAARFARDRKP
jgi:farnesyl diphosphate synthase